MVVVNGYIEVSKGGRGTGECYRFCRSLLRLPIAEKVRNLSPCRILASNKMSLMEPGMK